MIENGVGPRTFWLRCQPGQCSPPWATEAFGIGMLLMYSATECGDQIVQIFLTTHHRLLTSRSNLVSIATDRITFLYGFLLDESYLNS